MILDAGFLISVDRGDEAARFLLTALQRSRTPLHTTHTVVAQAWRNGARQARLAAFLKTVTVHSFDDGRAVGQILGHAETSDVVDAHLVVLAVRLNDAVLTGDPDDLNEIADCIGQAAPIIHPWP